jgi:ectoine hydroxylase-related dioxygenase (phytanoyl-CoA dioxygenase family)
MDQIAYHSKHGGLWIDRLDWRPELARRVERGLLGRALADRIAAFSENGYVILEGAAAPAVVDAFQERLSRAFRQGDKRMLYQDRGSPVSIPLTAGTERMGTRVVDAFVAAPEALDLFETPPLMEFLTAIFDETPLLFQSLSFDQGSGQGLHQDTAYVVVDRPLELAACWIALENVKPGSGELMYVPGSHRYPDFDFGPGRKHWNSEADGPEPHDRWALWIIEEAQRRGLETQTFHAKKGDILIWHADLAHGGCPIQDPSLTRQSLVGHFCPASRQPHYFSYLPQRRTIRAAGQLRYSSMHYAL